MSLRCKVGDLAIVTGSAIDKRHYLGRILIIVRMSDNWPGCWRCEPDLTSVFGRPIAWADDHLLPIRPGDLTEETEKELVA